MTERYSILIVEDEPIVALSLAFAVEAAGSTVLGPAASTVEALDLLAGGAVDAAIIDVLLEDRDITPVALDLLNRRVPFVVHSGTGLPPGLADSHPGLPLLMKPVDAKQVVAMLMRRIHGES